MDLTSLLKPSTTKILLFVIDGLGGHADDSHGSELEDAATPHLDELASEGVLGLFEPVGPGITPGSGPGHLALFGYDPVEHQIGRGLLSASGIGVDIEPGDVAARGNLCTLADDGTVADRRAGRVDDDTARDAVDRLNREIDAGVDVEFHHVKQHRVLMVLRGDFDPRITGSDPQQTGVPPQEVRALASQAESTARAVSTVLEHAAGVLDGEPVNGVLLRGFEGYRELATMNERFGLNAAAVAGYPMYRGVARLVGMEVLRTPGSLDEACAVLEEAWDDHDFFFVHHKDADAAGENGDRQAKIAAIEAADRIVPRLRSLGADVIAVSADHSTPSQLAAHSWHPVPTVVWNGSERDPASRFSETAARMGALGMRPTQHLMPLLLAMAGRLDKFGA